MVKHSSTETLFEKWRNRKMVILTFVCHIFDRLFWIWVQIPILDSISCCIRHLWGWRVDCLHVPRTIYPDI